MFFQNKTTWDPPAEWVKWDKKQHPEKYANKAEKTSLDLSVKNGGSSGSNSLDAIGLTANGNHGGLAGLNLKHNNYDPNSAASRLGGTKYTGNSKETSDVGLGGLGLGGLGLGGKDDSNSNSTYAVSSEQVNEESNENDSLIGESKNAARMPNSDKISSKRLKAIYGHTQVFDQLIDKCLDKCVEKCPKKCCCSMRWLWKYEGQPLKVIWEVDEMVVFFCIFSFSFVVCTNSLFSILQLYFLSLFFG